MLGEEDYVDERQGLNCYIHYSEYDFNFNHPTLVIQGEFGSVGYRVDNETGVVERCCICAAWSENECCCGMSWED